MDMGSDLTRDYKISVLQHHQILCEINALEFIYAPFALLLKVTRNRVSAFVFATLFMAIEISDAIPEHE